MIYKGYKIQERSGEYLVLTRFFYFWWIPMRRSNNVFFFLSREDAKFETLEKAKEYIDGQDS